MIANIVIPVVILSLLVGLGIFIFKLTKVLKKTMNVVIL